MSLTKRYVSGPKKTASGSIVGKPECTKIISPIVANLTIDR